MPVRTWGTPGMEKAADMWIVLAVLAALALFVLWCCCRLAGIIDDEEGTR
jgi:hypothetical protein